MPAFDASAPRIHLKVAGVPITAPAPYSAGHALTADEAAFLNRQVATAVANPMPKAIETAKAAEIAAGKQPTEINPSSLQSYYDERYTAYAVGASNRSAAEPTDPAIRFATRMAEDFVNAAAKAKGKKVNDLKSVKDDAGVSVYAKLVAQALERNPQFLEMAKLQVETLQSASADLDLEPAPAQ